MGTLHSRDYVMQSDGVTGYIDGALISSEGKYAVVKIIEFTGLFWVIGKINNEVKLGTAVQK